MPERKRRGEAPKEVQLMFDEREDQRSPNYPRFFQN